MNFCFKNFDVGAKSLFKLSLTSFAQQFAQLEDMEASHCLVRSNEVSKEAREEEFSRTVTPKTDGAVTFLAPGVSLPVGTGIFVRACVESQNMNNCLFRKAWKKKTN